MNPLRGVRLFLGIGSGPLGGALQCSSITPGTGGRLVVDGPDRRPMEESAVRSVNGGFDDPMNRSRSRRAEIDVRTGGSDVIDVTQAGA